MYFSNEGYMMDDETNTLAGFENLKIVSLMTPGVDSFCADYFLRKNELTYQRMYFNLGHKYGNIEETFLKEWYCPETKCCDYDTRLFMGDLEQEDAHIPNRNLIMCSLAQAKYDADVIFLHGVYDDRVSDNSREFREECSNILSRTAEKNVRVISFFDNIEKSKAVKMYGEHLVGQYKLPIVTRTYSCFDSKLTKNNVIVYEENKDKKYSPIQSSLVENYGCMRCSACFRRVCAITGAGLYVPFYNDKIAKEYLNKVNKDKLPYRFESIQKINKFLNWLNDGS